MGPVEDALAEPLETRRATEVDQLIGGRRRHRAMMSVPRWAYPARQRAGETRWRITRRSTVTSHPPWPTAQLRFSFIPSRDASRQSLDFQPHIEGLRGIA